MANVLILSLVFSPDGVSTAQLMKELAVDLDALGHRVHVVTTTPHYNRDPVAEAAQPLKPVWGGIVYRSEVRGVEAYHTPSPTKKGGFFPRAWGWVVFHILGTLVALVKTPRADVIIVPSPLLTIGVMGWFLTTVRGGKMIYNVQELYPDFALHTGNLRRGPLTWLLYRLEKFVYDRSAAVTSIGSMMARSIVLKGVAPAKVRMIPNFVDIDELSPLPKANQFSAQHHLTDRFVVSYAGNIGYAQGLETLLEAAVHLVDDPDIVIVFIGDGVLKEALIKSTVERGLANVVFIPHQPYSLVPQIYASSDISVVALLEAFSGEATPSKVYRIMACERPILAIAAAESDLAMTVRESGAGVVIPAKDHRLIAAAIRRMKGDAALRRAYGEAGRRYAMERVARSVVTAQYSSLVDELSRGGVA